MFGIVPVACHRGNSSDPSVMRSSSAKSTTGHLRAKQPISLCRAAVRMPTSPPKLEPTSPILPYPLVVTRSSAASVCCRARVVVISSNGPSLSPCPKKSKRNVAMPRSVSMRVKVLFVELFFPDRNPWHRTATRSVFLPGTVRIAETRWPCGSVKTSCSSTAGIVAESGGRRERQTLKDCRFLALVGPDAEIYVVPQPAPELGLFTDIGSRPHLIFPTLHHVCVNRPEPDSLTRHVGSPLFTNFRADIGQTQRDVAREEFQRLQINLLIQLSCAGFDAANL